MLVCSPCQDFLNYESVKLVFVPTVEELCIRVCFSFFSHVESGITNNHWIGSSYISY